MLTIICRRILEANWNGNGHESLAVDSMRGAFKSLAYASGRVHPASQPVVGASHHRHPVFDRAKNRLRAMLPLGRAFAKPAIIRQHHQKIRVVRNILANEMREGV